MILVLILHLEASLTSRFKNKFNSLFPVGVVGYDRFTCYDSVYVGCHGEHSSYFRSSPLLGMVVYTQCNNSNRIYLTLEKLGMELLSFMLNNVTVI